MSRILNIILAIACVCVLSEAKAQIKINDKNYTPEECLLEADSSEKQGNIREASGYLNSVAYYYWENKKLDEAIEVYVKSIDLNKKINNSSGIAGIESNLGMIYADKGDYESALKYMRKTLETREKEKEKTRIVNAKINVAVVLNRLGRFDESIKELKEAVGLAGEINDRDQMRTCYSMLAETYDLKGDKKTATQYFDYYRAMLNNIQKDHEKFLQSALDKVQHDIELTQSEKQEKEVLLKIKEKELTGKQSELQKIDSTNKELVQHISGVELQLQLLEKEEALNSMMRQKAERELEQGRKLNAIVVSALILTLLLLIIIALTLRRITKMNKVLKERNELISNQKKHLENGNKVRTRLLSILSHDLRTPLSGVHLMVQLMRSKSLPQEMIDKQLVKLDESLNISFQMLENMLYWTKNQMTGIVFKPEKINLAEVAVENIKLLESHIQGKDIEIDNQVYHSEANADKEMVNIIVRNIISNAVKFTHRGGKITISSELKGNNVLLHIADNGVGMSDEVKSKIFKFEIKSGSGTEKESGSGLGLELCQEFALRCKGNITFESKLGEGSKFTLSLPI